MNEIIKARWIADLRSGNHLQGTGFLRQTTIEGKTLYCCLGRLCEIVKEEMNLDWDENGYFDGDAKALSHSVKKYCGLELCNPAIPVLPGDNFHPDMIEDESNTTTLAQLNDNGYTFEQIAQIIEERL